MGPMPEAIEPTSGLVGHWRLDETSGTIAYDSAGSNDGAMQGGLDASVDSVAGQLSTALDFDGADDYIDLGDVEYNSAGITVTGWIYSKSLPGKSNAVVSKYEATGDGRAYMLSHNLEKRFTFFVSEDGSAQWNDDTRFHSISVSTEDRFPAGQWYHVAGTFDPGTGTSKIYVNGMLQGTVTNDVINGIEDNARTIRIGNHQSTSENYADAIIDDVRIYERVLSEDEIRELVVVSGGALSPPLKTAEGSGLLARWKMDETSGTLVEDFVGPHEGAMQNGMDAGNDSVPGRVGTGFAFDGTDDYIKVPSEGAHELDLPFPFTVAGWVYLDSNSADRISLINREMGYNGYQVIFKPDGKINSQIGDGNNTCSSSNRRSFNTDATFAKDTWHHVVAVFNGATDQKIYVNGALQATTSSGSASEINYLDGSSVVFGAEPEDGCGGSKYGQGRLDDVRVYNVALSDSQVTTLYNGGEPLGRVQYKSPYKCANPARPEGFIFYNADFNVMQYCNGLRWIAIGKEP